MDSRNEGFASVPERAAKSRVLGTTSTNLNNEQMQLDCPTRHVEEA